MNLQFNRNATDGDDMFFNINKELVDSKTQEAINFIIGQIKNNSHTTLGHLLEAGAILADTSEELCIITMYLTTWWLDYQERRKKSIQEVVDLIRDTE